MCIFCNLLLKDDDPSFILKLNGGTLYVNYSQTYLGRVLYVLNKHFRDISDLFDEDDWWTRQLHKDMNMMLKVLKISYNCDRIDVASLGNEVPHLHFHLIPRYRNEDNFAQAPWPHNKKLISQDEQIKMAKFLRNNFLEMWPNYKYESIGTV